MSVKSMMIKCKIFAVSVYIGTECMCSIFFYNYIYLMLNKYIIDTYHIYGESI